MRETAKGEKLNEEKMSHDLGSLEVLRVKLVDPGAQIPTRAHADDAGLDLYAAEEIWISPGQGKTTRTGVAFEIPVGHVGLVCDRSSMAKRGLKTLGGVIDAGYRGEVHIVLWNLSAESVHLKPGERIAQLLLLPVITLRIVQVAELSATARGTKGFGSTGR
jgi:dUTP pyrophosphatase